VNFFDYVSTLMTKLSDTKISSAVITTSDRPGVIGFVDNLDIATFLIDIVSESKDFTSESMMNKQWYGAVFSNEHCGNIINRSNRNDLKTVEYNTPLSIVVNMFSKEIHRVGVVDNGKLVNILSQSDMIRFLTTRGVYIGSALTKSIKDIGLEPLGVCCVLDTLPTVDAIRFMRNNRLSGVGIVDNQNRLVANFSATDLLSLNEENFMTITLPVKEFVERIHRFKPPVFAREIDTLETVLLKCVVHQVHRIYIVNEMMKPIGVLTLTDLLNFFTTE